MLSEEQVVENHLGFLLFKSIPAKSSGSKQLDVENQHHKPSNSTFYATSTLASTTSPFPALSRSACLLSSSNVLVLNCNA